MRILGISAFYHDSAACLVEDGDLVAAAQEERFTRKKHDYRFPTHALNYCLEEAGIGPGELDYVAFYDKPLLKFDRLLETYIAYAPRGYKLFLKGLPLWLKQKLYMPRELDKGLSHQYQRSLHLHRASRIARRQRLFSISLRRGGHPDARRCRRMGDRQYRRRARQQDRARA